MHQQRKCENCSGSAIDGIFSVKYDVTRDSNAGELQVNFDPKQEITSTSSNINRDDYDYDSLFQVSDLYFVHFFAPSNLSPLPKNIVFVIDVSGSMWGVKMKQVSDLC